MGNKTDVTQMATEMFNAMPDEEKKNSKAIKTANENANFTNNERRRISDEEARKKREKERASFVQGKTEESVSVALQTSKKKSNKTPTSVKSTSIKFKTDENIVKSLSHVRDNVSGGNNKGERTRYKANKYKKYRDNKDNFKIAYERAYLSGGLEKLYSIFVDVTVNACYKRSWFKLSIDALKYVLEKYNHKVSYGIYYNHENYKDESLEKSQQTERISAITEKMFNAYDAEREHALRKMRQEHPDMELKPNSVDEFMDMVNKYGGKYEDVNHNPINLLDTYLNGLYTFPDVFIDSKTNIKYKFSTIMLRDSGIGMNYDKVISTFYSFGAANKANNGETHGRFNAGGSSIHKYCSYEFMLTSMDDTLPEADGNYAFSYAFSDCSKSGKKMVKYLLVDGEIPHFNKKKYPVEFNYGRMGKIFDYGTVIIEYGIKDIKLSNLRTELNSIIIDPYIYTEYMCCYDPDKNKYDAMRSLWGRGSEIKEYYKKGRFSYLEEFSITVDNFMDTENPLYKSKGKPVNLKGYLFCLDPNWVYEEKWKVENNKNNKFNSDDFENNENKKSLADALINKRYISFIWDGQTHASCDFSEFYKCVNKVEYKSILKSMFVHISIPDDLFSDLFTTNRQEIVKNDFYNAMMRSLGTYIKTNPIIEDYYKKYNSSVHINNEINRKWNSVLTKAVNDASVRVSSFEWITTIDNCMISEDDIAKGTRITNQTHTTQKSPVYMSTSRQKILFLDTNIPADELSYNYNNNNYILDIWYSKLNVNYADYMNDVNTLTEKEFRLRYSVASAKKNSKDLLSTGSVFYNSNMIKLASNRKRGVGDTSIELGTIVVALNTSRLTEGDVYVIRATLKDKFTNNLLYEGTITTYVAEKSMNSGYSIPRPKKDKGTDSNLSDKSSEKKASRIPFVYVSKDGGEGYISYYEANRLLNREDKVLNDNELVMFKSTGRILEAIYINCSSILFNEILNKNMKLDFIDLTEDIYLTSLFSYSTSIDGYKELIKRGEKTVDEIDELFEKDMFTLENAVKGAIKANYIMGKYSK